MTLKHQYDENGNLQSILPQLKAREVAKHLAAQHAAHAARNAVDPRTAKVKSLDAARNMVETLRFKHSTTPDQLKFWETQVRDLERAVKAEQAELARREQFNVPMIDLIKAEADAIERSGESLLRASTPEQRQQLIAIARSDAFSTPEQQFESFQLLSSLLTDQELAFERERSKQAEETSLRANVDRAESMVKQGELQLQQLRRDNAVE